MSLPARIRTARQAAGLSQAGLAAAVGVSESAVSGWERGHYSPGAESLVALAAALRTTVCALLTGSRCRRPHRVAR